MRRKPIFNTISIALSFAFIGPVLAQSDDATGTTQESEGVLEEVVVTGSRIRRDSFNVSTPLVQVGTDQIQDTGLGSLSEILVD